MARLRITQKLNGLRRDVPSILTEGSAIHAMFGVIRELAASKLPLVTELELADNYGLLSVSGEIGVLEPVDTDSDSDPVGFLVLHIDVIIADELAYDHRNPAGPVSAYVFGVLDGMNTVFETLPGHETFFTDIGLLDPVAQLELGTSVTICT